MLVITAFGSVENAVAAIRNGKEPAVSGDEGVASLEIAIRCLESRTMADLARRRPGPRRLTG